MKGLTDTDPEVERIQLELLRQASPAQRFALMASWSKMLMQSSYGQILERVADERKAKLEWVRINYAEEVASRLSKHL